MLATVIDLHRWLRDDQETPLAERLNRDSTIGAQLQVTADLPRLLGWWRVLQASEGVSAESTKGSQTVALRRVAVALLFVAGLLLGMGVSTVAFGYEGAHPVNLFALLGVLVGIPGLLLIFTLLLLPGRLPGLSNIGDTFSGINPGRWVGVWLDRYADTGVFAGFSMRRTRSDFARWQLVVFSQWLAVGFFIGSLIIGGLLVTATDLAFGWSTTLELDASWVQGATNLISAPWSGWLPGGVPDQELVTASRIYRLESVAMPLQRVVMLGQWWPFVLMTILVYGLLPRLLLLVFGLWRLKAATRALLREDPEVSALLDRLAAPVVSFQNDTDQPLYQPPEESTQRVQPLRIKEVNEVEGIAGAAGVAASTRTIIWNEAASSTRLGQLMPKIFGVADSDPLHLAVWDDPLHTRNLLQKMDLSMERLLVVTKGWEPPVLEFFDFLQLLREVFGPAVSIIVIPLNIEGTEVEEADRQVWAEVLEKHIARRFEPKGDARIYVVQASSVSAEVISDA